MQNLSWAAEVNSKWQNTNSSLPFPPFSYPSTSSWLSVQKRIAPTARNSASSSLMLTGILPLISANQPQHKLLSQKNNSEEQRNHRGCQLLWIPAKCEVVFWRWKDLYTITELPSFPVPGVCFQGKQNLLQITPDIFCPAQQLYLRMFSRCLCLYETYNNKVVNQRRRYPDCKKEQPGKAWKLTSPHTKSTWSP